MNKYLTFPGKQPVYLGDIDFMQTAVGQAFANLLKNITGRSDANGILHGVVISTQNNSATWTAGVVSLGGEILPVEAGVVGGIQSGLYFDIVSTTSGGRTFGNGESHDCFETRSATLTTTVTDYPLASVPRIEPPSTESAMVYGFDDVPNLYDRYAKLAICGGALILMIRKKADATLVNTFFEGDVSGLPESILQKFQNENAPQSVPAKAFSVAPSQISDAGFACVISWSVVSGKLHILVSYAVPSGSTVDLSLTQILPIV